MSNRGKSLIVLDLIIVILLGALIYSFIRPNRLSHIDLKSQSEVEKGLSTLQVAIDMYSTKYYGMLPGREGEDISAIGSIIDDVENSQVFVFDEIDFEHIRNAFDPAVSGTSYKKNPRGYEIVVFARDRYPHKYVMTQEKIEIVNPEKSLITYLGELDGMKKDIDDELVVFEAVQQKATEIDADFVELNDRDAEGYFTLIDSVYQAFRDAKSLDEINQGEYEDAKKRLQELAIKVEGIKNVKELSSQSINNIGKISIQAEDYIAKIDEISSYLKAGRLIRFASKLKGQAEDVKKFADGRVDDLYPVMMELVGQVEQHNEEYVKYDAMLLDYTNKMQFVVQKFVDLKKNS